jgi:hypothetical protein
MEKKIYSKPATKVIKIAATKVLTGSGDWDGNFWDQDFG